ncbi:BMP family ABC transporter substrate-binding protein [Alkalicoccus daliensis]|uniref:Transcriptional activator of comK protein n=1 Tax=Alkalicoccus daliensis TaxID=745820 RepID=A0A1H0J490_9BACI|nr:BMP family ABC transporter substrate-binding protein [Alkalicoccus daliensis]SDO38588.1 transcriptional activator of comK gene [Alkalicoccus daliensis]
MGIVTKQHSRIFTAGLCGAVILIVLLGYYAAQVFTETEADEEESPEAQPKVSILTSDALRDQSWGSLAFQSKVLLEENHEADIEIFPNLTTENLVDFRIENEIGNGTDLLIGHGREFAESFSTYAQQYPDVEFVTLQGETTAENHTVYTFDITDAEVMAVAAAEKKSSTKRVGVLSKAGDWHGREHLEEALAVRELDITICHEEVESRNDEEEALQALDLLLEQEIDVIYTRGNKFNSVIIDQAEEHDLYVIGFIDDQWYMAKDRVITSVVINVPYIYDRVMRNYLSEEGLPGGKQMLKMEEETYGITPLGPMFSLDEKKELDAQFPEYDLIGD